MCTAQSMRSPVVCYCTITPPTKMKRMVPRPEELTLACLGKDLEAAVKSVTNNEGMSSTTTTAITQKGHCSGTRGQQGSSWIHHGVIKMLVR